MAGSSVQSLGDVDGPSATSASADLFGPPASTAHGLSSGFAGTLSVLVSKRF